MFAVSKRHGASFHHHASRSGIFALMQRDLAHDAERGQGRAEFRRGIGGEALKFGEGAVQPAQRVVEDRRELTKFIVGIGIGQSFAQRLGRNRACPSGHCRHGLQRTPRHPVTDHRSQQHSGRQREHKHLDHLMQRARISDSSRAWRTMTPRWRTRAGGSMTRTCKPASSSMVLNVSVDSGGAGSGLLILDSGTGQ